MLAYCTFNGIGIIPWAPLAGGLLARPVGTESVRLTSVKGTMLERKLSAADNTIINRVEELGNKKGVKMTQIALAWVGQKIVSPIVGVNSVERLKESIVTDVTLTPEEVTYLEEPYVYLFFLDCVAVCSSSFTDTPQSLFAVTAEDTMGAGVCLCASALIREKELCTYWEC